MPVSNSSPLRRAARRGVSHLALFIIALLIFLVTSIDVDGQVTAKIDDGKLCLCVDGVNLDDTCGSDIAEPEAARRSDRECRSRRQ